MNIHTLKTKINLISLFYRQSDGKTNRQIDRTTDKELHAEIHTGLQTDRLKKRQTGKQINYKHRYKSDDQKVNRRDKKADYFSILNFYKSYEHQTSFDHRSFGCLQVN